MDKYGIHPLGIVLDEELGDKDDWSMDTRQHLSKESTGLWGKLDSIYRLIFSSAGEDIAQGYVDIQAPIFRFVRKAHSEGTYSPDVIVTERMCQICVDAADVIGVPHVLFNLGLIDG